MSKKKKIFKQNSSEFLFSINKSVRVFQLENDNVV